MFDKLTRVIANVIGSPVAFVLATLLILIWAVAGPFLGFSEVWQLTVNTGTTIITFLLLFIVQNTQNRDTRAIHAKLDALIDAIEEADNRFKHIEELREAEIAKLDREI